MNNWIKSLFGVSGATLLVLIAMHGADLASSAKAAALFLYVLVERAPLGLASFLLASALGVLAQAFVERFANELPCPKSRDFALALLALLIGVSVMWFQLKTFTGLLLGLIAGFSAPFLYQGVAALWNLAMRSLKGPAP